MKTRHLGKILAVVFFVLLFAVVLTVSVGAEEHTIPAGDVAALQSAVANAAAGDTVTLSGGEYALTGSLSVTKSMTIQGSGTVTLKPDLEAAIFDIDAEGVELIFAGSVTYEAGNGTGVLLKAANATIRFTQDDTFNIHRNIVKDSANATGTASVYVTSGNFTSIGGNCMHFGDGSEAVTLVVNGGTFTAANFGFNFVSKVGNTTVTVQDATVTSASHCFNFEGCAGTVSLTVKSGNYTGRNVHFANFKLINGITTLNIEGGTIASKDMGIVLNNLKDGSTATISGGTFTTNNRHIVHVGNTQSGVNVTVNVSGGTFLPKVHCFNLEPFAGMTTLNITGGTFTPGNSLVVAQSAAQISMTGGTVTSCVTGFNMIKPASATVGETGMHSVISVSGNAAINASSAAFSATAGHKSSVTLTGGAGLVSAKTPFNVDSSSTLNKTINGASYVNGANTVYTSFGTALSNVAANGTVTVMGNNSGSVEIKKGVTITGSGTVTSSSTIFNVRGTAAGATITFAGSVRYESTGGVGFSVQGNGITFNFNGTDSFISNGNLLQDSSLVTGGVTTVNVLGGSFTSKTNSCFRFGVDNTASTGVLNISGGIFDGKNLLGATVPVAFTFAGGTATITNFIAGTGEVTRTVNAASYTNAEGKSVYTALVDAIANVPAGGTVTVHGDTTLTASLSVTKSVTINGTGTVTLKPDLNAAVINIDAEGVELTLGGSVVYTAGNGSGVCVTKPNATVNFKDTVSIETYRNALRDSAGATGTVTVTVSGGSFTSGGGNCFYFGDGASDVTVTVNGGTFKAPANICLYFSANTGSVNVIINGGTFTAKNFNVYYNSCKGEGALAITNGSFTAGKELVSANNASAALTMTGGTANVGKLTSDTGVNTDGVKGATYTVAEGKIGFAPAVATALANVVENGTVTIYGDHVASLEIKKGMTITGTGSVTAEWTVFNVRAAAAGSTINLEGSVQYVSQKGVGFSVQGSGITFNLKGDISFTTKGNVMQDAGSIGANVTVTVNVSGGTYKSEDNCFRFGISDTNGHALSTVNMTVSGGTFEAKNAFVCISGAAADIKMTGGKVSTCTNAFNAYSKVEGTPTLEGGDNVKVVISGEARIHATQFVLSSTAGYRASIGLEPIGGYIQSNKKLYNVDASSVLVDTVTGPYVQYVGEGLVGIGHIRSAVANAAPGSMLTVYGSNVLADGALDITKSLTFTGEGTISTRYTTFNIKNNENIVLIVGGNLNCISREGVGVSIGAANAQITFKDNVTFQTKANFIQDSDKVTIGTVTVNILGGTYHSESNGIYLKTGTGMVIVNISGGTVSAKAHCICTHVAYAGSARINITDGTLHALGENASFCVHLGDTANDASVACNIYGGTFLNDAGYSAICSASNTSDVAADKAPRVNIYGGYFMGNRSACVQATDGGIINIWGGYFRYVGAKNVFGSPVIAGSGSTSKGTVNVYGGNFVSEASGPAFSCANNLSVLNLYGGYNAVGGGYLANNKNTSGGTPTTGYPVGQQHYTDSIYMTDGAGVRIADGNNGLRFVSVITAEALAYIQNFADGGSISYGTLIAPVDLVREADSFTHDGMTRAGVKFVDVPAKNGLVARAEGGYYIRAAIVNILPENIDREFAAVSYVRYTVNNKEVIVYSVYREHKNARSIQQVARLALEEAELYTAEQLEILRAYAPTEAAPVIDFYLIAGQSNAAGSTNFQADFANSNPNFKNGYANVYYSGLAMSGSPVSSKMAHACVLVKIGYGNNGTNFGPELGLADALSTYYNAESGKYAAVIKYAYSGICLRDDLQNPADAEGNWCPPSWLAEHGALDPIKSGQHYRTFVKYIEECIADYEAMGFKVNIVAAYWMQGEQDVTWNGSAGLYDELLTCLVNDLRRDVAEITGDEKYLKLPFMIGELSAYLSELTNNQTHFNNTAALIQAQHDVAAALENVYVLAQSNLPSFDIEPGEKASNKDRYHWISHNMLWIGQQLGFTALEQLLGVEVQLPEESIVAEVYLGEELIGSYNSLVGAISQAPAGATVKLTKDITMYSTLVIGNTNAITLDGCGHSLTFVVPTNINTGSSEKNENCGAFRLYATDLTVKNLSVSLNVDVAGVYKLYGAVVTWESCTFAQQGTAIEAFEEVEVASTVVVKQTEN